jgi:hypothetical protein
MEYRCEDLSRYGVVLFPPSSPEYAGLFADIQKRLTNPIAGSPPQLPGREDPDAPTMILCNRSPTAIAAPSWIWRLEPEAGRPTGSRVSTASVPSVLAPFGLEERQFKLYGYWHVILPGSKRGIRGNSMFGDNTDVRPPQPDEVWKGGVVGGAGSLRSPGPLKSVTLTLDGIFFLDGGFAGPDTLHSFDRLTADVDAHLQVARLARDGHYRGLSAQDILQQIAEITGPDPGPAPPPPPLPHRVGHFREDSLRNLAWRIGMMRQHNGDDRTIYSLMLWTETPLPKFRRLS